LDAGVYFDPEDALSIARAIEQLVVDPDLRQRVAGRARTLAAAYSWDRCAIETWKFLALTGQKKLPNEPVL
jgi:glycosyltransferase involved in cell wall biosynthesis